MSSKYSDTKAAKIEKRLNYSLLFIYSSPTCECNSTSSSNSMMSTTMNPTNKYSGSNAGTSNPSVAMMMMMTGCICNSNYPASSSSNGKTSKDEIKFSETILSSNIKFQTISAIAVAQDGVINVADQGKEFSFFLM